MDMCVDKVFCRHGWPEDLWFHVDDLSSAHVYLRLPRGETFESVPEEVVEECASLVKHNSIKVNIICLVDSHNFAFRAANYPSVKSCILRGRI